MAGANNEHARAEVLAVIPARGGSKGLPRKNILPLAGKPLIAYSIEAALASKLITRVVVSTDDQEIAEISRAYGAEVPFMRPAELAGDRAKVVDAINHTLRGLEGREGYKPRVLATLYPTHPFRTPEMLDELVSRNLNG
jgi:CMP-N-acetylneuraminic acid synthetase